MVLREAAFEVVGERWLNASFAAQHGGQPPSEASLALLWAAVIASKEVGKVLGTFFLPLVAERPPGAPSRPTLRSNSC